MTNVPFDSGIGYRWVKTKDFIRWNTDHRVLAVYHGEESLYILVHEDDGEQVQISKAG
jgi:hypothetical protein